MQLTETKPFFDLIGRSREVLCALPRGPKADAVSAALALKKLLEKQGKTVEIVADSYAPPERLQFLPSVESIRSEPPHLQKLTFTIDLGGGTLSDVRHEVAGGIAKIHVTPSTGAITRDQVSIDASRARFDCIITIGAAALEDLGTFHEKHPELFFRVPVVNIDHAAINEHYGTINLVDLTAASLSELIYRLFAPAHKVLIDEEVATTLLAGILSATRSFKHDRVSPDSLSIAAELVALGGRREEVVKNLYRTRSVATLKLWGRALVRLKHEDGVIWTLLTNQDFVLAGATETDLEDIADELIANAPDAEVFALIHETKSGARVRVETRNHADARELTKLWRGTGSRHAASFELPQGVVETERLVIPALTAAVAILQGQTHPPTRGQTDATPSTLPSFGGGQSRP